ncbi:hypothetical protein A3J90_03440 [candidate division WOR-1 bacterium RIFOXYC2_FULL_37_10]|uniref:DUF2344 domain-containing protein n=1 Tax=candidate division WOR-1 bacterium RIFOXYB2_FULL_37_13 TaxID=1802579 RepID=A0A1F4SVG4_UNCSA|nr:MAG: hypothetical protein A2246_01080 [candidate division WOR-1 bacterium RIFOXYA2_FULL_37_7]OGC24410.1 MAG: hypothetical protein A2310_08375 [candidate division WOR-1 bacterium RIFOXYB2_FULL_37_13]OGC37494.1 MAG: hypothetical protein A3J90_03440 [candidate division WOR-1 bacterium RIFOXYC2_FULL_37_10]
MEQNYHVIKIKYSKGDEIKYISHLDLIRALERAIRRAGLPIAYSQGFNPRMLISYKTRALKVGETSDECEAEIKLLENIPLQEIKNIMNTVLPKGMEIAATDMLSC